jgi:DNA topoisomerase IB
MASKFRDGIRNFVSSLVDGRNPINQNVVYSQALTPETLRQLYRHGIGNKVIRLKSGHALNDTIQFESTEDALYYKTRLEKHVKKATKWMIAFGRGIIVLHAKGDDLSQPFSQTDSSRLLFSVFSGDMVTAGNVGRDLQAERYYRPLTYNVRGVAIHWSRVVDFRYIEPPELDAPRYMYGGISEFEMIYEQIIADGIVQRASPRILEKASTLFYKIAGFKDAMRSGQDKEMIEYFGRLEDVRGVFAAGLIDAEDGLEVVSQSISNLAEADQITLRRLAMVTGIPLAMLVGENVKGLNSTGENERQVFQDMIESLQSEYLLEPITELMRLCGQGGVKFKENQGDTPNSRMDYETKAITNAEKLAALGEDYRGYLIDRDVLKVDEYDLFAVPPDDGADDAPDQFSDDAGGDFDEGKIKRSKGGQFSSTGGGGGGSAEEKQEQPPTDKFEASISGKSESDQKALRAAKADGVAIPPAWTNVSYYGKDGENGIIAQGTDAKGRRQRQEVPEFRERMIREKHERIAEKLSPRMGEITDALREQAVGGDEEAKVLYLITQTGFRIGGAGDGKAKEQAFGASTLRSEHVKVDGDTVHFDFPGKKGVRQQHTITDPVIADMMRGVKPGEPVFKTRDAKVRDKWKSHGGEKVHDIRSHVATETARAAVSRLVPPKPKNKKELDGLKKMVAEEAARRLGNRPSESLKTYINHDVFEVAK